MLTHTLQGEPKNFLAFAFFPRAVDDGFVEKGERRTRRGFRFRLLLLRPFDFDNWP